MMVYEIIKTDTLREDSPVYTTLNIRAIKEISSFKLAFGVNNLFNYSQPPLATLKGKTEYYWGPIIGREFYITASWELGSNPSSTALPTEQTGVRQVLKNEDKEIREAKDPVCGMEVSKGTSLKVEYQNETYYFCNQFCKDSFSKEPEKYIKKQ